MEFFELFFGCKSFSFYLAAMLFVILGFFTSKFITFKNRKLDTTFSLQYWIKDNWVDVILALLLSFSTIRFTEDLLSAFQKYISFDLSFISDVMFYYYLIGLTHQSLLQLLRKKLKFLRSKVNSKGEERK